MLLKWIVVPCLFIIISSNIVLSLEEETKPSENSLISPTASINSSNVDINNVTNPAVSASNDQHEPNVTETTISKSFYHHKKNYFVIKQKKNDKIQ